MNTVVELPEFIKRVTKLLNDEEHRHLIVYLAANPKSGVILQGTGGIRKLRWKRTGTGKRGGVRVVYFFYNDNMPLFLLTVFGKSEKDNLSVAERKNLRKMTRILVESYGDKHE